MESGRGGISSWQYLNPHELSIASKQRWRPFRILTVCMPDSRSAKCWDHQPCGVGERRFLRLATFKARWILDLRPEQMVLFQKVCECQMPLLLTSCQRWNPFRIAFVARIAGWLSYGLAEALGETYPKLAIFDVFNRR